jgi:hypothetical protein
MDERSEKAWLLPGGSIPFYRQISSLAPKRHGQSLHRCAPGFSSYDTGAGVPHVIRADPKREEGKPPRAKHVTATRL